MAAQGVVDVFAIAPTKRDQLSTERALDNMAVSKTEMF